MNRFRNLPVLLQSAIIGVVSLLFFTVGFMIRASSKAPVDAVEPERPKGVCFVKVINTIPGTVVHVKSSLDPNNPGIGVGDNAGGGFAEELNMDCPKASWKHGILITP